MALWPDIEPDAASNTAFGTPDASSAISKTFWLWTPASASGCSARDVLHEINVLSGLLFSSMRSDLISSKSLNGGFKRLATFFISAKQASKSCELVGAVTTVLLGTRIKTCQTAAMATPVDLPTPWPERTDMRRLSGSAIAPSSSTCHSSGSMPITSRAKATGSPWYRVINFKNGLSVEFFCGVMLTPIAGVRGAGKCD